MKEVLEHFLVWCCCMITLLVGTYCVSFGWHQAKQVVLVNSNAEILSHITIIGE